MFPSPFQTSIYQLYLLQLENYSLARFVRASLRSIGRRYAPPRTGIIWTGKLKLVFAVALLLQTFIAFLIGRSIVPSWAIEGSTATLISVILLYAFSCIHFVFLSISTLLTLPFDVVIKHRIITQARKKIAIQKNLTIIGITGSYGKTTMKEMLATILSGKYRVLKTPENINTPVGIARLILSKLNESTDVFIVEMGAYYRGDIKTLCGITPPDISILTGINESHLERFGTIENTIATKFEIVEDMKEGGLVILNADDERVRTAYERYIGKHETLFYSAENHPLSSCTIVAKEFFENGDGVAFSISCGTTRYNLKTALLGEYVLGTIAACVRIAERLGMGVGGIEAGVALLKPVPHRLEPRRIPGDILIIDDSYNGNPRGVAEAIAVLARFASRRKIYITPGLVEMGERSREVHRAIGRELSAVADMVVLIDNSVTGFIREGLEEAGFIQENSMVFPNAKEAHMALKKILQAGDVILFQNDWPEGYV